MENLDQTYKRLLEENKPKDNVKEELKGGQKNLDKNHNGKLDGQDFVILRNKKKKVVSETADEPPFDKPYTKSKGAVTSKSGMNRARDLARSSLNKSLNKTYDAYNPEKDKLKKQHFGMAEEVKQIDEANHRDYACASCMHPTMAKNMKTGEHMDYYEPKTGDKVHGKVMHKSATEVHMKQTHDSYDPKKAGSVHKFKVTDKLPEKVDEVLKPSMGAGAYIDDFIKSKNPQFAGKSSEKRRQMALAAYYAAKKGMKEEAELEEGRRGRESSNSILTPTETGAKSVNKGTPEYAQEKKRRVDLDNHLKSTIHNDKMSYRKTQKEEAELEEGMYSSDVERAFPNGKASGVKTHAPVAPVPPKKKEQMKPRVGHPTNMKEEAELEEGDLTIRHLYNKFADAHAGGHDTKSTEKVIKKVHGDVVMGHMKKAAKANAKTDFDGEDRHFDNAQTAGRKTDRLGSTVGRDRSAFRKRFEEVEQLDEKIYADDYHSTSETSQFGGHRPHVIAKDTGKTMYLGQHAYKTPKHAIEHAQAYLSAYSKTGMHGADRASTAYATANKHNHHINEAKDPKEYGYEGDMAMNQLKTLVRCAEMIEDCLKPDTDLPEWVQSKITLATDYIQTAADYLYSEMDESTTETNKYTIAEDNIDEAWVLRQKKKEKKPVKEETVKSFKDFITEMEFDKNGKYVHKGKYGTSYDDPEGKEDSEKPAAEKAEKRGRGRPAGAKSGARQIGGASKKGSGVEYTGYKLHLPNSNK